MPTLNRPDGTQIYYQLVGNRSGKLPLVLIHGWCSSHELWVHQVKYFGKKHRILVLDRRGHGRSSTCGSGHNAATHAADIAAVTTAAGLKSVVAIGHAGGGAGTLQFIRENPKLVKAGVLIDTSLGTLPKFGDPGSPFGIALAQMVEALKGPESKTAFREMYSRYFNPKGDRKANARAVADAARTPDAVKIAELEGLIVDTAAIADHIVQPVLWLTAGKADQSFIRSHLENVGFAQVSGANHFPHFEQPGQANAMIETFLSRI
jgi:pimeloyl-ACP methyl ester carboxylesterase